MKINPDQSQVVKPDAERDVRKGHKAGERFEDLLFRATEKVGSSGDESSAISSMRSINPGSAMSMTPTELLFPIEQSSGFESKAMDTLDNLLSRWENYAHQLTAQPQGLRQANGILEDISTEIGALKANWPQEQGSPQPGPELRNMLDELEVMAVTERIKFNRGDYI